MNTKYRPDPLSAAHQFIKNHSPHCVGAILAGSVVRGEATDTSDLDIVIFDQNLATSYRESHIDFGWNIEVFVHNLTSYKTFFKSDCERAKPSMPRMVSEGIVLKDEGIIESIKKEATELLEQGPKAWSPEAIKTKQYFLTDLLDDFIGCKDRAEGLFIANSLALATSEFVLRTHNRWIGTSKWTVRALRNFDPKFTDQFVSAFDLFYKKDKKDEVIHLVEEILQPYGGRLFDGFSLGKK